MSGPTAGGNYIIQSGVSDAVAGLTFQCSVCGAEYTDAAVAKECYEECSKGYPMPPVDTHDERVVIVDHDENPRRVPEGLRSLMQVANRMMRDVPMPAVRSTIQINGEEISLEEVLHDALHTSETRLEAQEDMAPNAGAQVGCQQPTGSDDVCGLPMSSPMHDFGNRQGHNYMAPTVERTCTKVEMGEVCGEPESSHWSLTHPFECAGVAQSAEQGFRKAEVVGSTPTSSSMKLNKEQVEAFKLIVHYRVQLEDLRKAEGDSRKALDASKRAQADAQRAYDTTLKRVERQGKEFETLLYEAEATLRRLIVEDVLIKGTPEPAPEPEKPAEVVEEHDELGRAE